MWKMYWSHNLRSCCSFIAFHMEMSISEQKKCENKSFKLTNKIVFLALLRAFHDLPAVEPLNLLL